MSGHALLKGRGSEGGSRGGAIRAAEEHLTRQGAAGDERYTMAETLLG